MIGGGTALFIHGGLYLHNYILRHVLQWITTARTFDVTNESSRPEGCRLKENISCYYWKIKCKQISSLMISSGKVTLYYLWLRVWFDKICRKKSDVRMSPFTSHPSPLSFSQFPVMAQFRVVMQKDNRHSDNWQLIADDSETSEMSQL